MSKKNLFGCNEFKINDPNTTNFVNDFKAKWKELFVLHHEIKHLQERSNFLYYVLETYFYKIMIGSIALISYFSENIYYFVYATFFFLAILFILFSLSEWSHAYTSDSSKIIFMIGLTERLLKECQDLNELHPSTDESLEAFLAWSKLSHRIEEQKQLHQVSLFRRDISENCLQHDQERFIREFDELYQISDI